MSIEPTTPSSLTPWPPETGGRRRWLLIAVPIAGLAVLAAVLFAVFSGDDSGGGPLGNSDQSAAEEVAEEYYTATLSSNAERKCELEVGNDDPAEFERCVELSGGELERDPGEVNAIRSLELGEERGWAVEVEFAFSPGDPTTRRAVQVVDVGGQWRIEQTGPIRDEVLVYAEANGLDPIAVALGFDDVAADD